MVLDVLVFLLSKVSARHPKTNTLFLLCATPKCRASRISISIIYPRLWSESRRVLNAPVLSDRTPGTFSHNANSGLTSSTTRSHSSMRLPLGSFRPSLKPAIENAWQGLPPTTRSTAPRYSLQSTFVMSPRLGTLGKRSARTALGKSSISENATGSHPSCSHATDAASMPLKTLIYRNSSPFRLLSKN